MIPACAELADPSINYYTIIIYNTYNTRMRGAGGPTRGEAVTALGRGKEYVGKQLLRLVKADLTTVQS